MSVADVNGDGKEDIFASWQTDPWSPAPVGPTDPIPVNEYKNIELELLNPGLVHIEERGIAKVAKQLGMYVAWEAPATLLYEPNDSHFLLLLHFQSLCTVPIRIRGSWREPHTHHSGYLLS